MRPQPRFTTTSTSLFRAALALALALMLSLAAMPRTAAAAQAGDRIDLKVLLLSANGAEASFLAWKSALQREGVPFDTLIANSAAPITSDTLQASPTHARYQAVVLATGDLLECTAGGCFSALDAAEWAALNGYQTRFGVRRVVGYTYPTPVYGLNYPFSAGEMAGTTAQLTTAGKAAFPYLAGPVAIDTGAYGYAATPLPTTVATGPVAFETLLAGPADAQGNASALIGVHNRTDGFQELVITVDGNAYQLHSMLLAHGLIQWVTGGVHLGYQRSYFTLHIDDIFLGDDRWDVNDNVTYEDEGATNPVIRMVPADVTRAINWQKQTGLKLDMVFNGGGSVEAIEQNGSDPLTTSLLKHRKEFRWINHTYSHPNLDFVSEATIYSEITENLKWAAKHHIRLDPRELVTGEHSGLQNPAMPAALAKAKIKWTASDRTYNPMPYFIGDTITVPRHPANVYYNVGTLAEQLDEYNYVYFDACTNTAVTTCLTAPATYAQYVDSEASIMLRHLLTNDPRPHYFHQSNLAEEGTLYPVVNEVLKRYQTYLSVPLWQPTFREASHILSQQIDWQANQPGVTAWAQDGRVYVQADFDMEVPVTGADAGSWYGGDRSGWFKIKAGEATEITQAEEASLPKLKKYKKWWKRYRKWLKKKAQQAKKAAKKAKKAKKKASKKAKKSGREHKTGRGTHCPSKNASGKWSKDDGVDFWAWVQANMNKGKKKKKGDGEDDDDDDDDDEPHKRTPYSR